MVRTGSGLSRPVLRWVAQVAASLGATLAAAAILSAVHRPPEAPRPEMTSGGKFAARAAEAVAYDGLDTMPLPRVAPAPRPADLFQIVAWEALPTAAPSPGRAARPPRRASPRAEARRAAAPVESPPPAAAIPAAEPRGEPGFLASAARPVVDLVHGAWGSAASAGEAVAARAAALLP